MPCCLTETTWRISNRWEHSAKCVKGYSQWGPDLILWKLPRVHPWKKWHLFYTWIIFSSSPLCSFFDLCCSTESASFYVRQRTPSNFSSSFRVDKQTDNSLPDKKHKPDQTDCLHLWLTTVCYLSSTTSSLAMLQESAWRWRPHSLLEVPQPSTASWTLHTCQSYRRHTQNLMICPLRSLTSWIEQKSKQCCDLRGPGVLLKQQWDILAWMLVGMSTSAMKLK